MLTNVVMDNTTNRVVRDPEGALIESTDLAKITGICADLNGADQQDPPRYIVQENIDL